MARQTSGKQDYYKWLCLIMPVFIIEIAAGWQFLIMIELDLV